MYNNETKQEKRKDFKNEIKVDANVANMVIERKKFLEQIDGNEAILNMLSTERLYKLEKYYNNIIEQNEQKIKKLKETT